MTAADSFRFASVLLIGPCLAGQGLESATATLRPSGGVEYQASFTFFPKPLEGAPVVGAPYSAVEVSNEILLLESGAVEEQSRVLRKLFRDSKGRTRIESRLPLGPTGPETPRLVEILDIVSGFCYVLDIQAKVAHRYRPPAAGTEAASEPKASIEAPVAVAGQPATLSRPSKKRDSEDRPVVKVATLGPVPPPPSEILTSRDIDGVAVDGIRYTTLIPTESGLRRFTTSEIWTSPELHLTVLSKFTDSQRGERTIRLRDLSRSEPDPGLFQVPAGYRIQDERGEFRIAVAIGN